MISNLKKKKWIKQLEVCLKSTGGWNNLGRITAWHWGGGYKKISKVVNWNFEFTGVPAKVLWVDFDKVRSGFVALVCYSNGVLSYILATEGLQPGDVIMVKDNVVDNFIIKSEGSVYFLKDLKVGDVICNLESAPGWGSIFLRSAGVSGQIKKVDLVNGLVVVKLWSGEEWVFSGDCRATYGVVSNSNWRFRNKKKAGFVWNNGRRPVVRGAAMNPVDHPHGGWTVGGRPCVTPWGRLTKGVKTWKVKKPSDMILKWRSEK